MKRGLKKLVDLNYLNCLRGLSTYAKASADEQGLIGLRGLSTYAKASADEEGLMGLIGLRSSAFAGILVVFSLLLLSCGRHKADDQQPQTNEGQIVLTPEQAKNAGIVMGKTEQKQMSSVLSLNGVIDVPPQNMVSVSAPLGGYLKSTELLPGTQVKKGEVIAVMEDPQYIQIQQDYLTAKARSVFSEKEYQRQKELNVSKASSDKTFQQSEADYKTQLIQVKALYEKLKLIGINPEGLNETNISRSINIYSPINGFVSRVNVNIGKYVNPAEVLFDIVNPVDIHLALTVFEKDISKLYEGQSVIAWTNANPDKKYRCKVLLVGQDLSRERNTVVHCHFETYDKALVPGMFMNAEVELRNRKVDVLPEDAVVTSDNRQYVFVSTGNNRFEMVVVKTGTSENGFIEIVEPALHGRDIVVKGAYSLLMKTRNTEE